MLEEFDWLLPWLPGLLERAEKLEQLWFLEAGYTIHTIETRFPHIAVDTPEDLVRVRRMLR